MVPPSAARAGRPSAARAAGRPRQRAAADVGGTIEQSGVDTIGIAQSIDPGNYDREESGHAVGNVISHEVGHLIGNWHTDNTDRVANLMDAGGENFGLLFGVGKDGVGGTKDDPDVDFGKDAGDGTSL